MGAFEPRDPESFGFQEIRYAKNGWVATVTINRPQVYNSYSSATLLELTDAFLDASWDDSIAVVVLTGEGDRAFSTGGDVREYAAEYTRRPHEYWKYMQAFARCHDTLRNIGKPTIARLNGIVAGGGNEFNMACDLAIAAEHVTIRQVGTRVGSVAAGGATQWLPIMIGDRRAREMLFLCEPISARQALDWGLVNQVVPSIANAEGEYYQDTGEGQQALAQGKARIDLRALDEAIAAMAEKLVDKFPECLRYTKQQVNFWKDLSWHSTIGHAAEWLALHFGAVEPYEGMRAFVEKRQPRYRELREKARDGGSSEYLWGAYERSCAACGAGGLPEEFRHCGVCGAAL